MFRPLRLRLDRSALQANWYWLAKQAGVACAAAVKANGYGLGGRAVLLALHEAGCRHFFVSTWDEAAALGPLPGNVELSVLHGVGPNDHEAMQAVRARPVLNSVTQVSRWKEISPREWCDVMIDTGMNRLGLRPGECEILNGLNIATLMSHLVAADEDCALNKLQHERFRSLAATIDAQRYSLANSAGILLGREYSFDLVRPGLALYGGVPRREGRGHIRQVARLEAQVVQRRVVHAGEGVGYGATFIAKQDTQLAILNLGYADGYFCGLAGTGKGLVAGEWRPVLGRISMDSIALDCGANYDLKEGDWVEVNFQLPEAAAISGKSQYEILTGLGDRFDRRWA